MQEIEAGNYAIPRWVLCPPDSIRVVNWNINRGLKLKQVIEFLASAKADLILLQETDLNGDLIRKCSARRERLSG